MGQGKFYQHSSVLNYVSHLLRDLFPNYENAAKLVSSFA